MKCTTLARTFALLAFPFASATAASAQSMPAMTPAAASTAAPHFGKTNDFYFAVVPPGAE
jgi:hypothetical protein